MKSQIFIIAFVFTLFISLSCEKTRSSVKTNLDTGKSEEVYFSDPGLEAAIRKELKKPSGTITDKDLQTLISIDAGGYRSAKVANINGLEHCKKLEKLKLKGKISDISPLNNLTNMKILELRGHLISDLRPLSKMNKLCVLDLSRNRISDINPLNDLINLQTLVLSSNKISDLRPLKRLIKTGVDVFKFKPNPRP